MKLMGQGGSSSWVLDEQSSAPFPHSYLDKIIGTRPSFMAWKVIPNAAESNVGLGPTCTAPVHLKGEFSGISLKAFWFSFCFC